MGVQHHESPNSFIDNRRGWDENTQTWTYKRTLKPLETGMIGKVIVDELGRIYVVEESNDEYVFIREHDVKGAGQEMLAIVDLTAPHAVFFDSTADAQVYVANNFEDETEDA